MEYLHFDFSESNVDAEDIVSRAKKLDDYRKRVQELIERGDFLAPEASVNVPSDTFSFKLVDDVVQKYKNPELKYIVLIGIGGSNLGTMAIYQALFGTFDAFKRKRFPKILFLDTVSAEKIKSIVDILESDAKDDQEFVINVVSKSGKTTETMANFEVVYKKLSETFGDISSRVVITTDEGSPLWNKAQERGFTRLSTKKNVGGRYSVFSAVGLFPLGLVGIDTRELLDGAQTMRELCIEENPENNPAVTSAAIIHTHYEKGIDIHNSFFFAPELEHVGRWYRQLVGESLGKRYDVEGKEVHAGITPIVSIGSTALHSMAQLYFGGPHDKFTTIITTQEKEDDFLLSGGLVFDGVVEGVENKTITEIMSAIGAGVRDTYSNLSLPFASVELPEINTFYIGQFLQYKMMEVMYLAKLMHLNAFDQPSVQMYKKATQDKLQNT